MADPPVQPLLPSSLSDRDLDQLIRAIIEEVLFHLGALPAAQSQFDASPCPDCDGRCIEKCAARTREVIDAGAERISAAPGLTSVDQSIAALIDHTLLKPDASRIDVEKLCHEALRFHFASVCINPWYVPIAAAILRGSPVKVCTVIGFPLGATLPQVKIYEAEEALKLGAQELDMVQNIGALKSGQDDQVEADIRGVVETAHRGGAICKVILETALLTPSEKVRASLAAKRAGADFVKTSTGFSSGGATAEDVALMRAAVGAELGVKASGGIRTLEDLQKMVTAGATRIGASTSVKIIEQARSAAPASLPATATPSPASSSH